MSPTSQRPFLIKAIAVKQNGEGRRVYSNSVSANDEKQAILQAQPAMLAELRIMREARFNPCADCLSPLGILEILAVVSGATDGEEHGRVSATYLLRIDGAWVEEELTNQRDALWEWVAVTLGPGTEQNTAACQPARKTDRRLH